MEGTQDNYRLGDMEEIQESNLISSGKRVQRDNNVVARTKEEESPARKRQRPPGMGSMPANLKQMTNMRMEEVETMESKKEESHKQDREGRKEQMPQSSMENKQIGRKNKRMPQEATKKNFNRK